MVDRDRGGKFDGGYSRRSLLRSGALAAGGIVATGGTAAGIATDPVASGDFEEREWGYVHQDFEPPTSRRAAVLEMDGYGEGEPATHYLRMRDDTLIALRLGHTRSNIDLDENDFVTAQASVRGTGCSGGRFDLFDQVHALDGYEIIEWLADREWTYDGVGLYGKSYSGLTAFYVAATQPPSLAAAMPTKLIADLYRGIAFPGGVPNGVFTSLWTQGLRPALDTAGTADGLAAGDPICAQNVATRDPQHPADHEVTWYTRREDDTQWRVRSLITYADQIEVPTYISHAWQDEQTGPRGGPELFNAIEPDPVAPNGDLPGEGPPPGSPGLKPRESPKLFRATNGVHATADQVSFADAENWFRYWLLGEDTGIMSEPRVTLDLNRGAGDAHTKMALDGFPDEERTEWTRLYLSESGTLTESPPEAGGSDTYATGSPRRSWFFFTDEAGGEVTTADGPDALVYRTEPFDSPMVIAGPITATLYVESTAPEMDLFVAIGEEHPDGSLVPLQRGMLRASHRDLDEARTLYNDEGDIIRPYRPHTNPDQPVPGDIYEYHVEVFPLGHLVHPDRRLVVTIHTPPATDGLWGYEPSRTPGVNTVYQDEERPSSVLLPLVEWEEDVPPAPGCGEPAGYRCL